MTTLPHASPTASATSPDARSLAPARSASSVIAWRSAETFSGIAGTERAMTSSAIASAGVRPRDPDSLHGGGMRSKEGGHEAWRIRFREVAHSDPALEGDERINGARQSQGERIGARLDAARQRVADDAHRRSDRAGGEREGGQRGGALVRGQARRQAGHGERAGRRDERAEGEYAAHV